MYNKEEIDPGFVDNYLKDATILKMRSSSDGLEGGLVIKFSKDDCYGLYVMGYTEIGNWVYYFEHKSIHHFYNYEYNCDKINAIKLEFDFITSE